MTSRGQISSSLGLKWKQAGSRIGSRAV